MRILDHNRSNNLSTLIIHLGIAAFCITCLVPLILTISISLSSSGSIANYGYTLIPKTFALDAYKIIFANPTYLTDGYKVSLYVTIVGTIINLIITALIAYPLSRASFKLRGIISVYIFITMIFGGGLVPSYLLVVKYLHWKNTMWALMIPSIAAPFNIFLLRVFFQEIPISLIEAAKIDGSSEFNTFIKIVLPLAKPALATMALLLALGYWNDAFSGILYIDNSKMYPLQVILNDIVSYITSLKNNSLQQASGGMVITKDIPSDALMYATMVVTTAPILFLFSFLQKYFVKGAMVGSVKG